MTETTTLAEHVAAEIRAEMGRQRKRQAELAAHLGVTQASISKRLAGKQPFAIRDIERIADWLGVDVTQFLARVA